MNIRNIKLALTVELMNDLSSRNYLGKVKALMRNFSGQVGAFRGEEELKHTTLNNDHSLKSLVLEYDNCILNIDLVTNNTTRNQFINRFDLAA